MDRRQSFAAIAVGTVAMSVAGVQPLLLSVLAQAGRFSEKTAHLATLAELACMGLAVAAAGLLLAPRRLRRIGVGAGAAYALLNLLAAFAPGEAIVAVRAAAGLSAGLLIWITIGTLARLDKPEPLAAAFFMTQSLGQLVFAATMAAAVLPAFGPLGACVFTGLLGALAIPAAAIGPDRYTAPSAGLPSPRGFAGLLAILAYVAAGAAVWFHLRGFAREAGLDGVISSIAIVATLGGQIAGAAVAVATAGRVRFVTVFPVLCALTVAAWALLALRPPAIGFVAAFTLAGFAGMVMGTKLFSFLTGADPSRRSAAVSAAAQLLGAALGPALAPLAGRPNDVLLPAAGAVLASLALAYLAALTVRRPMRSVASPTSQPAGQAPSSR